jgi:hypothetical protein
VETAIFPAHFFGASGLLPLGGKDLRHSAH